MSKLRTLRLTLHKKAFAVMVTGEKPDEFREISAWIESRLLNKDGSYRQYDQVEFTNGYGKHRPRFTAEFQWAKCMWTDGQKYSNGLVIQPKLYYVIHVGKILSIENYELPTTPTP